MIKGLKVDPCFQFLLDNCGWYVSDTGYAYTSVGRYPFQKKYKLHRVIMGFPSEQVDHINGDKLDNRLLNLRLASNAQNQWNSKISKNNKTGFKGVWFEKSRSKYMAQIRHSGYNYCLGRFDSPEEAFLMYGTVALELFGEFAKLDYREEK